MKAWQEKALRKGRTPLPESPGARPWLDQATTNDMATDRENANQKTPDPNAPTASEPAAAGRAYATRAATAHAAIHAAAHADAPSAEANTTGTVDEDAVPETSSATPGTTESSAPSYTFWRTDDLRRLIEMRNGGAKWASIAASFPERTLEALKQTYHKRRYAMEAQMAEEHAEEREASAEAN